MLANETCGEPQPRATGTLGEDELHAYHRWTSRPEVEILSALMVRAQLFWGTTGQHVTAVGPSRRSDCTTRISWKVGLSASAVAHHLTGTAVGIPGAHITEDGYLGKEVLLTLGTATVELDGPHARVRSIQQPSR